MSNEKKKDNEDIQSTQKRTEADRKIKIREIYEKAVRTHGETLEKLSKH